MSKLTTYLNIRKTQSHANRHPTILELLSRALRLSRILTSQPAVTLSSIVMSLETLTLEHLPETHHVHLALFRNVQNASFLHEQLLARNSDFEYAFIDASTVRTSCSEHICASSSAASSAILSSSVDEGLIYRCKVVCGARRRRTSSVRIVMWLVEGISPPCLWQRED